jgi:alpha-tubulin suppressor-like RCC1 family protein
LAGCTQDLANTGPRVVTIAAISGNNQVGPVGGQLTLPLVVRVVDQLGAPVTGAEITFQATSGGGAVTPRTDTTDADGYAETRLRLGGTLGAQSVSATLAGLSPITFAATATAAPAARLSISEGDGQTGPVGGALDEPLAVLVTDAFDNPRPGVPVTFTVLSGGGAVTVAQATSDNNGIARTSWTLGTAAGTQTVSATAGSLSPLTFSAIGLPDDPAQIVIVSGNNQTGVSGGTLADSVVVRVADQYGNGVGGITVNWDLSVTDGSASPTSSVTNSAGRAATRWTFGPGGGPKVMIARVENFTRRIDGAVLISYNAISAGGRHSCALGLGGVVYCWGFNGDAELGIGDVALGSGPVFATPQPAATTGNVTFRDISTGMGHSCAVALTGEAFCWGSNVDGRIGQQSHTTERFELPQQVRTTYTFTDVSSGRAHNCGIGFSTRPVCWGSNHDGEAGVVFGPAITTDSATIDFPQYVNNPVFTLGAIGITAGGVHGCAATAVGQTYCWGNNVFGQLGDGTNNRSTSPALVTGAQAFIAVAAGGYHTCGLTAAGAAWCWGSNSSGQLGAAPIASNVPVAVTGAISYSQITTGTSHSCGLGAGGIAYCWGDNTYGQLGDGSTTSRGTPAPVVAGVTFASISAGDRHTCAISTGNIAYCWGDNEFGALGDGTLVNRSVPVKVRFQP